MRRFAAALVAVLPILAQQDAQLSLGGTVTNSKTGEPIRRALVTVTQFSRPNGQPPLPAANVNRSAFTDAGDPSTSPAYPPGSMGSRRRSWNTPPIAPLLNPS